MVSRLIVPLDQSDVSESALPLARGLATKLDCPVTLVMAVDVPSAFARHYQGTEERVEQRRVNSIFPMDPHGVAPGWTTGMPTDKQIERVSQRTQDVEKYLKAVSGTFGDRHVDVNVQYGRPAERILHVAEQREGSVIVMASHGRSGLRRAAAGSVASRVVQASTVPVFVARGTDAPSAGDGELAIDRVVISLDGSMFAEQAIRAVQQVFGETGVQMHLFYAVDPGVRADPHTQEILEDYSHSDRENAEAYLGWVAERLSKPKYVVTWSVGEGEPSQEISREARNQEADLIVMTTHGRAGFGRFVLGSVAEDVLNKAEHPLMLLRPVEE